jgi:TPR repeat protein
MRTAKTVAPGAFLACSLLFSSVACADLTSAEAAYQKSDYVKAFQDFRELAEIGQPAAQFNLAVMYVRGEGVRQSEIYAYAWASLAAENGLEKAKDLADKLRPDLAPGSEKLADDIRSQFGNACGERGCWAGALPGKVASDGRLHVNP